MNLHLDLYPTSIEQCYECYEDAQVYLYRWNSQSELTKLSHQQADSRQYTAYSIASFIVNVVEQHQQGTTI